MIERLPTLWPEITLFIATCVVMIVGVSPRLEIRRLCAPIAAIALLVAGLLATRAQPDVGAALPNLAGYAKAMISGVALLLVLLVGGVADRQYELRVARGEPYNPLRATRAEFYAFLLFSLTGAMLCAGAEDLVVLFLALELTSLPTYIMVTMSTARSRSFEAGVKYFFLGALGAAIFLYGFALLYGGTGTTSLAAMRHILAEQAAAGGINPIALAGALLAVLGIGFKIAAVPMHFYTPDVYQGAAAPISAFLAFVPKTAGFLAIILLTSTVGWTSAGGLLPPALHWLLWIMAVLTMTVGNVLAILQGSVKRILAYSSIAHSGYMLVGIVAGPGEPGAGFARNGLAAVLFYLLAYGVMNLGAFAVIACLERPAPGSQPEEIDSVDDLRGLCSSRPMLGWIMVLSSIGLLGMPPLLGFFGKLPLFTAGIGAGQISLVVILGINSAIAAFYYLRLAAAPLFDEPAAASAALREPAFAGRRLAGILSAAGVVILSFVASILTDVARLAGAYQPAGSPLMHASAPEPADQHRP